MVYYPQHNILTRKYCSLRKDALVAHTIETNPSESSSWRKHKNGCPFYRERWFPDNDVMAGEPMYQVFCMKGTPPVTQEEEDRCLHSKSCCWRLAEQQAPSSSAKRRRVAKDQPLHSS